MNIIMYAVATLVLGTLLNSLCTIFKCAIKAYIEAKKEAKG